MALYSLCLAQFSEPFHGAFDFVFSTSMKLRVYGSNMLINRSTEAELQLLGKSMVKRQKILSLQKMLNFVLPKETCVFVRLKIVIIIELKTSSKCGK